jgi:hypothetical protein
MRHDRIDPGSMAGVESPPVRSAAWPSKAFTRRLEEWRRRSLATVTVGDEELATLDADVVAREWRELEEIAAARGRLADGTFGRCELCGASIGRRRLEAMPTARYCLVCQREVET